MSTHMIPVLEEIAVAGTSTPIYTGPAVGRIAGAGSQLFRRGQQVLLDISRAGVTGALTVYGADMSDPNGNPTAQNSGAPLAQVLKGDNVTTNFQTAIAYVALANFNWIVVVNGTIQTAAQISAITNVGGLARVDFVTAPAANAEILVFYAAVTQVYTGTDRVKRQQVRCYDFMWTLLGATPSACSLWLMPCGDG